MGTAVEPGTKRAITMYLRRLGLRALKVYAVQESGSTTLCCYVTTEREARHARVGRNDEDKCVVSSEGAGWPPE